MGGYREGFFSSAVRGAVLSRMGAYIKQQCYGRLVIVPRSLRLGSYRPPAPLPASARRRKELLFDAVRIRRAVAFGDARDAMRVT